MNILCATDDNYVPYCGVMLTSLFEQHRGCPIAVYLLTEGLTEGNRRQLSQLAEGYGQRLEVVAVDSKLFEHCPFNPATDHISLATYYRLAAAEILPRGLDRVLYVDCDIIFEGDCRELYAMDLGGKPCAAVVDESAHADVHYRRLGLPRSADAPYFNAGVLLIDLDYWCRHRLLDRFMAYIAANRQRLAFHDQDTLNATLRGLVAYAPIRYNLQTGLILCSIFNQLPPAVQSATSRAAQDPAIVHFTGASKPWQCGSRHPFAPSWLRYRAMSPWAGHPLIRSRQPLSERLLALRNEIIWHLHIMPRPVSYIVAPRK